MTQQRIIVPVSGGKDSQTCFALAVEAVGPENVVGIHQWTGFDHPITYEHMDYMQERYGAPIHTIRSHLFKDVPDVIARRAVVPSHAVRICTKELKLSPWFKWLAQQPDLGNVLVMLGVRQAESSARAKRYKHRVNDETYAMVDTDPRCPAAVREVRVQMPIVTWSTPGVLTWLRRRGDKINPLYSKGHSRVGCYPCVLAGPKDFRLAARDEHGRVNLERMRDALKAAAENRPGLVIADHFEHDIDAILANKEADPFGFSDVGGSNCSWCNM